MGSQRLSPVVVAVAVDDVVEGTTGEITEQQSLRIGVGCEVAHDVTQRMVADGLKTRRHGTDVKQIVGLHDDKFRHKHVRLVLLSAHVEEVQLHIATQNRLQMAQVLSGIIHRNRALAAVFVDGCLNRRLVEIIDNAAQIGRVGEHRRGNRPVHGRNPAHQLRRNGHSKHRRNEHRQCPAAIKHVLGGHRRTAVAVATHFLNRRHVAHMHAVSLAEEIDLRKQVAKGDFLRAQRLRTAEHQRFVHQAVHRPALRQVQDVFHTRKQIVGSDVGSRLLFHRDCIHDLQIYTFFL